MVQQRPGLSICPACGGIVAWSAQCCPHCGFRPPSIARPANQTAVALGLAGLLLTVGTFMPWLSISGFLSASSSGLDGDGLGAFALATGITFLVLAAMNMGNVGLGQNARAVAILGGAAVIAVVAWETLTIGYSTGTTMPGLFGTEDTSFVISVGIGLFVSGSGGLIGLLVGLVGRRSPEQFGRRSF
jgi:hypothetical protein